jgi:Putative Flp pilus-assembly TadE/G-like
VQGEISEAMRRQRMRDERGQVLVLFAVMLPVLFALGAIVIAVGNWFVQARMLQTKVDAAALAGGTAWGFPCGADIDTAIENQARLYLGDHTAADGSVHPSPYNHQFEGVGTDAVFATLNQAQWWGGAFPGSDFSSPAGSVCASKILDVKATEHDAPLLWRLIPLFPDIKRKARVEIQDIAGLTGLLPIAVRLPQPLSAAAVFYNEASPTKAILAVKPFRHVCIDADPACIAGAPAGLGQWTTEPAASDVSGTWASVNVAGATGVVVATSVRPGCDVAIRPPCLDTAASWVGRSVDDFCRQAATAVQCFDADGGGATQTVSSGVHFIQGYSPGTVGGGRPELRNAWLESVDCPSTGYFNSTTSSCRVKLNVVVDLGSVQENPPPDPPNTLVETRTADHVEVRYCVVRTGQTATDVCTSQFGTAEDMQCSGGPGEATCSTVAGTHPLLPLDSRGSAFAIQIRLRRTSVTGVPACSNNPSSNYANTCRFFYTGSGYIGDSVPPTAAQALGAPVQRSFMGHLERTGPLKWLRLTVDRDCDPTTFADRVVGHDSLTGADAASQPAGTRRCYVVDLGMAGGLARDQDEPPIAFNLGDNSSQRAYVDCDSSNPNLKAEIVAGCQQPAYASNRFDTSPYCPGSAGFFSTPKPDPFANWPPYRCVLTQTGNSSQVIQGFNERIFHTTNNPSCPSDDGTRYVEGRNYWHRMNNAYDAETFAWNGQGSPGPNGTAKGNTLRSDDPRLVTLFFTTYDSFTNTGNETYPIVGFGNFYVTGYGETISGGWKGGAPEDPCTTGNDGDLTNGTGNEPPPDLDMSRNTRWVWGHFVKDVAPNPQTTGGSGFLCNPVTTFDPCVPVLVE